MPLSDHISSEFREMEPHLRRAVIVSLEEQRGELEKLDRPTTKNRELIADLTQAAREARRLDDECRNAELGKVHDLARGGFREGGSVGSGTNLPGYGYPDGKPARSGNEMRNRALDLIERSEKTSPHLTHDALEHMTELVERDDSGIDIHARWILDTGSDDYRNAFAKALRGRQHEWSYAEAAAIDKSRHLERAMGLTDASGGYMIPAQLDPAIILTSGGSVHPFRQIARQVTATGDVWSGVASAGASAEWTAEAVEVADASPTLTQPTIPIHKYDVYVPYSVEVEGDAANFLAEISGVMSDAVDQLHATAFATGTGTGQPTGIITALVGGSSIVTGTTMTSAEVYATQNALPPRFQPNARWAAALPIANTIAQFESAAGARLFPEISQSPRSLLGRPFHEASTMDSTIAAGATADYVLLYGDFSNYVIADRVGTRVEIVPHLMGTNRRPTLQRGLILWGRVGADSVNDNAFRLLNAAS